MRLGEGVNLGENTEEKDRYEENMERKVTIGEI